MNQPITNDPADHVVCASGILTPNAAAEQLQARYQAVKSEYDQLGRAWIGAYLASLLIIHPWLRSAVLSLSASYDGNDQGRTTLHVRMELGQVVAMPNVQGPDRVYVDGVLDPEAVSAYLHDELQDAAYEFYTVYRDEFDAGVEVVLPVLRDPIEALLASRRVSGSQVFAALFAPYGQDFKPEAPAEDIGLQPITD